MTDSQRKHGWYLGTRGYQILTGLIALIATFVLLWVTPHSTSALTTVPTKMNFQGRLTDSSGNIMPNGTYNMRLKLYTVSTAGSAVWSEDRLVSATQGVPVTNGLFSIKLGDITTLPASLFASGELYLEVELPSPATATSASPTWSEGPMTPRNQMATSAYAYNSETLDGLDSAAFGQLSQNNTWSGSNTFSGSVLAQGSLTLGTTAAQGSLVVHDGNGQTATIVVADTAGSYTYTLPVTTSNDTLCLQTLANCGGAGSGVTTVGALDGGTANANGASITGNTIYLQSASGTYSGLVNTSAQSFAGVKTFNSGAVIAAGQSLTVTGGTTGTRPGSPTEGMVYYDTTTKQLLTYANGKWQQDRTDAVLVAASNSSQADKDAADYVADGNTAAAADGDQVQINQALTAGAGKKVVLLAGTYVADATILIPNNTTFAGVGQGTVIELADIDATDNLIENSDTTTGTGVTIQDMKLDGRNDLNTVGTQKGVYLNGMGDATTRNGGVIRGVVSNNFINYGLQLNASHKNTIQAATTNGNSSGLVLASSSHNTITGSHFGSNVVDGVWLWTSTDNSFSNNTFTSNDRGIFLNSSSSNNTLSNNTISSNANGISMTSSNNTILGNSFKANTGYGLSLTGATYNTISGNIFSTTTAYATYFYNDANNNTLSSNYYDSNGNASIGVDNSDSNQIVGNKITNPGTSSISVYNSTSDANYLADNSLGGGSLLDSGTGTIYGGQLNATGQLVSSSSGGTVSRLQPSSGSDLYQGQNSSGTALFKVTSTGAIQGTSLDTIGATTLALGGTNATAININQDTTVLAGKTLTVGTASNGIILSDTGYTLAGTARNSKRITLAAEYANAVLDAGTGSNNTGAMTAGLDLTNRMNYYKWTTTQGTNQSYDVVIQVPIPSDFSAWASTTPITVTTRTSDLTNGLVTIEARDTSGTVVSGINFASITPTATGAWQNRSAGTISGTYTAGGYMTLRLRMQSPNAGDVRIGNITLDYLSKW